MPTAALTANARMSGGTVATCIRTRLRVTTRPSRLPTRLFSSRHAIAALKTW